MEQSGIRVVPLQLFTTYLTNGQQYTAIGSTVSSRQVVTCGIPQEARLDQSLPQRNDDNMSTQHIATLLGSTCCVRLATVLRCVATCWVLLAQV